MRLKVASALTELSGTKQRETNGKDLSLVKLSRREKRRQRRGTEAE